MFLIVKPCIISSAVQDMTQCNSMSSSPISTAALQPEEKLLGKETLLHLVAGGSAGQIICYEFDNVYKKLANIEV